MIIDDKMQDNSVMNGGVSYFSNNFFACSF